MAQDLVFDREQARAACGVGYLDATDLADLLVKRGVPFREAHDRVGAAVNAAIEEGVPLERLSSDARAATMPELDGVDLAGELGTDALLARRLQEEEDAAAASSSSTSPFGAYPGRPPSFRDPPDASFSGRTSSTLCPGCASPISPFASTSTATPIWLSTS